MSLRTPPLLDVLNYMLHVLTPIQAVEQERRDVFESSKKTQMIEEAAWRKEQFERAVGEVDEDSVVEEVPGTSADDGITLKAGSGGINCF